MFSSFAKSSSLSQVCVCALCLLWRIIFLLRQNLTLKLYATQYNLEFLSQVPKPPSPFLFPFLIIIIFFYHPRFDITG